MSVNDLKPFWEGVAKGLLYVLFLLCAYIGKEMTAQLKSIQADLAGIKVKLAVLESRTLTPEMVKQIVEIELEKRK